MNNTIVTTYGESCQIIQYMSDFCGCCRSNMFNEWYNQNEAYFVTKGIFVVDDLMFLEYDDKITKEPKKKPVRFCMQFDLSEKEYSSFTFINYYNQEKIANFRFLRKDNPDFKNIKIKVDYVDYKKLEKTGVFGDAVLDNKLDRSFAQFKNRAKSLPPKLYKESFERQYITNAKLIFEYMSVRSIEMLYSCMFYYTKEKPQEIAYSSYFGFQEDLEYTVKKETYIYKYTGYINLNDTKIYKTKINKSLDYEKKKEYDRHIESWTVRGHYRNNKNGKKYWVKDYIKGEGVLETRIFGTKPESEVLLIPKLIECERDVRVSVKRKVSTRDELYDLDELMEINYKPEPPAPKLSSSVLPLQSRYTRWQRIKILFRKISSVIFKNNKNDKHN